MKQECPYCRTEDENLKLPVLSLRGPNNSKNVEINLLLPILPFAN